MKNVNEIAQRCMAILDDCEINYTKPRMVGTSARYSRSLGKCYRKYDDEMDELYFEIKISDHILADDIPMREVENTMLHELIHTCRGAFNHGAEFVRLAGIVNRKYGYHISRTSKYSDFGLDHTKILEQKRYEVECVACNGIYKYSRMGKVLKNLDRYRCGCGGKLVRTK